LVSRTPPKGETKSGRPEGVPDGGEKTRQKKENGTGVKLKRGTLIGTNAVWKERRSRGAEMMTVWSKRKKQPTNVEKLVLRKINKRNTLH